MATITLRLTWQPPVDPTFALFVLEVWHNGKEVGAHAERELNRDRFTIAFEGEADQDGDHVISWNTSFSGQTIRDVRAAVLVDGMAWDVRPKSIQGRSHKNDWDEGLTALAPREGTR